MLIDRVASPRPENLVEVEFNRLFVFVLCCWGVRFTWRAIIRRHAEIYALRAAVARADQRDPATDEMEWAPGRSFEVGVKRKVARGEPVRVGGRHGHEAFAADARVNVDRLQLLSRKLCRLGDEAGLAQQLRHRL